MADKEVSSSLDALVLEHSEKIKEEANNVSFMEEIANNTNLPYVGY